MLIKLDIDIAILKINLKYLEPHLKIIIILIIGKINARKNKKIIYWISRIMFYVFVISIINKFSLSRIQWYYLVFRFR